MTKALTYCLDGAIFKRSPNIYGECFYYNLFNPVSAATVFLSTQCRLWRGVRFEMFSMSFFASNAIPQMRVYSSYIRVRLKKNTFFNNAVLALFLSMLLLELATPRQIIYAANVYAPVVYSRPAILRDTSGIAKYVKPPFREEPFNESKTQYKVISTITVQVTAYSSSIYQTDSTPYTTAKNTMVRDGVIAANFLSFGTRVRFPEYFGDKVFIVEDRMNTRYWKRIDVWMPERDLAIKFGIRSLRAEIVEQTL